MPLSKTQAKLLANILTSQQRMAMQFLAGKNETAVSLITEETINDLLDLDLAKRDRTVERVPREVLLLTTKGKKVAQYV